MKAAFLVIPFLAVLFVLTNSPIKTHAMVDTPSAVKSACKRSPMNKFFGESVFLSATNTLYVASANRTFQGCWTYWPQGPCRAIYSDRRGNYSICGQCDESGNPGGGGCSNISPNTLNSGYWCS